MAPNTPLLLQGLAAIILGRRGSVVVLKVRKAGSSTVETVALERFESDESKHEGRQDTQPTHESHSAAQIPGAGKHHKGQLSESAATLSRGMETEAKLPAAHHEYRQGQGPSRGQGAGLDAPRDRAPESILRRGPEQHQANEAEQYPAVRHDPSLHPDSPSGSFHSDQDNCGWEAAARDLGQGVELGYSTDPALKQVVQSYTQLAESTQHIPFDGMRGRAAALQSAPGTGGTPSSGSGLPRETAAPVYYGWKEGEKRGPVLPDGSGSSASSARYGQLESASQAGTHSLKDSERPMQQQLPNPTKAHGLSAMSAGSSQAGAQVHHRRLSPPPPPPVAGSAEATMDNVQRAAGGWQGVAVGGAYADGDLDERCSLPRDPSLDRIQAPNSAASATLKGKATEKLFGLGVTFKVAHT